MKTPPRPPYESADRWNRAHPPGTPVQVTLANGLVVDDSTASHAQQWGSLALVTLRGRPGMWPTDTLMQREAAA